MAYITARELRAVVPDQYRDAALADQGGEQPDPGLLAAVIDQACEEVDALIEGRVRLPLSAPYPQKIRTAAVYFALEIMFTRRGVEMPEATARKIAGIRSDLGKVGAGDLRLEAPAEQTAASRQTSGSIVVRPSITGAGGMIGAILLLISCLARPAQAIDARTFSFVASTNPLFESPDYVEWCQAESVGLRYAVPSADSRAARWEISDATNLWLNMAPTKSGTNWYWNPAPTQTCLAAGRYQGRVALYDRSGTNLVFHRILALQDIRVHPARDPATLIFASPLASIGRPVTEQDLAEAISGKLDSDQADDLYQPVGDYLTSESDEIALRAIDGNARATFENPYRFGGTPYKGQTHFHTTASDGAESPETMVTAYKNLGFDFVSITDHDGQPTANPGVDGILFIPGVEESAYRTDLDQNQSHVVSFGATAGIPPTNAQDTINAILAMDAVPLIAHPSLTAMPWPTSILDRVIGYVGVEVYNGNVPPEDYYVDRWDSLLSKNVAAWGLAVDDAHRLSDVGNGWIVVYAEALTTNAVKAAIRRGSFYATQGPDIRHSVTGGTIYVATSNAASIAFYGRGGSLLAEASGATSLAYAPHGGELYVRAEVQRESDGKRAWGQPFYIKARRDNGSQNFAVGGDLYAKRITTYGDMTVGNNAKIGGSFYGPGAATNSFGGFNFSAGIEAFANSTGNYNLAVGRRAMNTSTGNNVSAVGLGAGDRTIGNLNSFIGSGAGQLVRGGTNTALGSYAMYGSTGQVNVVLGNFVGYWSLLTNSVVIGNNVGKWARGVSQMFFDSYTNDFPNATYGPTNAVIYSDNGNLSLGRGGVLADGKANVLRGSWTAGTFAATEVSAITLKGETMDFYDPANGDYCAVGVADRTLTFRGSPAIQHDDTDNAWVGKIQAGAERISFWSGTQAQYDAIVTKSATTVYFIRP